MLKNANFDRILIVTCFSAFIYNILACVMFNFKNCDVLCSNSIVKLWLTMSLLACFNIGNINRLLVEYLKISTFTEIIVDCILLVFYCIINELAFVKIGITIDLRLASMMMFCSITVLLLLKMRNKDSKFKFLILFTFIVVYYIIGKVINRQLVLTFMEHIAVALLGPTIICLELFPRKELNIIGSFE